MMADGAKIIDEAADILLPQPHLLGVSGEDVFVFQDQGDGKHDLKSPFAYELQEPERRTSSRSKPGEDNIRIQGDPGYIHCSCCD